jgi:hypothetical protein
MMAPVDSGNGTTNETVLLPCRFPLAKLTVGESHTIEGQRLEVNESLTRYQRELKSLAMSI